MSGRSSPYQPYGNAPGGQGSTSASSLHSLSAGGGSKAKDSLPRWQDHRSAEQLESQNDEMIDGIGAKVKLLKAVRSESISPLQYIYICLCLDYTNSCNCLNLVGCRDSTGNEGINYPINSNGTYHLPHLRHSPLRPANPHLLYYRLSKCSTERRFRRNRRHSQRDVSTDERNGKTTRRTMGLLHDIPHHGLLVLHRRLVVPVMSWCCELICVFSVLENDMRLRTCDVFICADWLVG